MLPGRARVCDPTVGPPPAPGKSTFSRKRGSRSMANNSGSVQDKSKELGASVSHAASDVKNKAADLGSAAVGQAKETASHLASQAREAASAAGNRLSDAANYAGQRADDATASVGGTMKSLASQVRQNAPREGMMGSAADAAASAGPHRPVPPGPGSQRYGGRLHERDPSQPHPGPADRRRHRLPDRAGHHVQELISWPTECKPAPLPAPSRA